MTVFTNHRREQVSGAVLDQALNKVADDWIALARAILAEDPYASHVTEAEKDDAMRDMLAHAETIRAGNIDNFGIWQRVNEALTGECVPLFAREHVGAQS